MPWERTVGLKFSCTLAWQVMYAASNSTIRVQRATKGVEVTQYKPETRNPERANQGVSVTMYPRELHDEIQPVSSS